MRAPVEWLMRIAIQRWPASLREERAREWAAELHHLGHWGRLRFAWSLAVSPPVNDDGVPVGWRETVPAFGRGLQPLLALFGAGLLCVALASWIPNLGVTLLEAVRGHRWPVLTFDWAANSISVAALALSAGIAFFAGRWMGARIPVWWAHRGRLSRIGSAVLAPAFMVSALVLERMLFEARFADSGSTSVYVPDAVPAFVFWAVCFTVVASVAVAVRRGWLIGLIGTLVVLDLVAIITAWGSAHETVIDLASAPLWFPLSLLDLRSSGVRFGEIDQGFVASEMVVRNAAMVVRPCLAASVFVLGYAFAAKATAPSPVAVRVPIGPAAPLPALRGWVIAGAGLALWVYALTALTGALNDVTDQVGEHHIWAHEIRQAAILVMITGLALAIAGRGAIVFPALLAFAALWAIDSVFDARDAVSVSAALLAAGLGVLVLYGASLLARMFRTDEIAVRRSLAGFAVFSASCAPAVAFHWPTWETLLPTGFFVASGVAVGLLLLAALVCASAVRGRPMWIAAVGVAALAGLTAVHPLAAFTGAPLAVIAVWFMRPRKSLVRRALVMLAALVAAMPVGIAQMYSSFPFADALMAAAGYSFPVDGVPFLPGSILLGTVVAIIVAARIVPRRVIADTVLEPAHTG